MLDLLTRAGDEGVGLRAMLGEVVEGLGILLLGLADTVVVVGMHHRTEADLVEDFGEQAAEDASVKDVRARDVVV